MKGTVFWLKERNSTLVHPWVIISDEVDGLYLGVNITDIDHVPDTACAIDVGEHSVVTKPSGIYYKGARRFPAKQLKEILHLVADIYEPCNPQLLNRIIQGAFGDDDFTPSLRVKFLEK